MYDYILYMIYGKYMFYTFNFQTISFRVVGKLSSIYLINSCQLKKYVNTVVNMYIYCIQYCIVYTVYCLLFTKYV